MTTLPSWFLVRFNVFMQPKRQVVPLLMEEVTKVPSVLNFLLPGAISRIYLLNCNKNQTLQCRLEQTPQRQGPF